MSVSFARKGFGDLDEVLRQIEEQAASKAEIKNLAKKVDKIDKQEPKIKDLVNGQERLYDDGSNVFLYRRVGGRLFKIQMTEV